jgi:hypothetical protein
MRLKLGVGGIEGDCSARFLFFLFCTCRRSRLAAVVGPLELRALFGRPFGLGIYGCLRASDAKFDADRLSGERLDFMGDTDLSPLVDVVVLLRPPSMSWRQLMMRSEATCACTGFTAMLSDPRRDATRLPALVLVRILELRPIPLVTLPENLDPVSQRLC